MARSRETKIELTAYDDLFQTDESREEAKLSKIRDIPISEIDEFPDHPFKVLMDEDMEQLVESIKRNGVMTPATVRLKEDGRYELISGHRRKKACELAGLETLKCEVKELTRDEAIIVMVESNLQRSVILPSEKAFAVAKNPQAWQGFLSSACRNYKCRFDEQLLIYAQRPDAVAVAKLETWNRQFKRWVNKDSKGIAVFDPKGRRNDKDRQQPERSEYNERNHLQQTGGLSYSRPNITDRARASAWQVRFDAQGLSGEAQASDLSQSADIGQAERASARGRADSTPEVGASDEAALSRAGRDRGTERESTDAVGRTDEQHPQPSGGSDTDRTDLQVSVAKEDEVRVNLPTVDEQIEMIAKAEDEKASAFAISKEDIDSVLQKGSGVADGKYRIYRQFQKGVDRQKNIEFLKNEYGTGGGTHIFPDGFSGHSWHDSKGLAI